MLSAALAQARQRLRTRGPNRRSRLGGSARNSGAESCPRPFPRREFDITKYGAIGDGNNRLHPGICRRD